MKTHPGGNVMIPLKVGLHNKDYRSKLASFEEQKKYILHFKKALA